MSTFNPYTEFKEFDRKQIQHFQKMFKHYDINKDQLIDAEELFQLMDKIRAPQTKQSITDMIQELDEDQDGMISVREFLLLFRKGKSEQLQHEGLKRVYYEINIDTA